MVTVNAPLGRLPVFVKAGAILPLATQWDENRPHDATEITLTYVAMPESGQSELAVFYDDGLTREYQKQTGANRHATAESTGNSVSLKSVGQWQPEYPVNWLHDVIGAVDRTVVV